MTNLVITNGVLVTPLEETAKNLYISDGEIVAIGLTPPQGNFKEYDAGGAYVTPGLIDLQMNGGPGCDLWQLIEKESYDQLALDLARHGVTAFLPTLITAPVRHLQANIKKLKELALNSTNDNQNGHVGAKALGIHLEGPFLSAKKPGVHPKQNILPLNTEYIEEIYNKAITLMTVAAEEAEEGAIDYLLAKGVKLSLGHSNATFEEAQDAFGRGVNLVTHLFNAMPAIHHRQPGLVTAALLNDLVYCQFIADGLHLNKAIVDLIYRVKGADKCILVSDRAAVGTSGGSLVGSSITLDEAVANLVKWNIASFCAAIKMAAYNPALILGQDNRGLLAPGYRADLALFNVDTLKVEACFVGGQKIH
jgi:N-acetylglucosamine-6-phosphate deacetylase